ncbi:MAG: hypothetical protein K8T26_13640 [Lentisphaerae bacterium]|nr:hypothetical protein [Lentisphaerota bacterium]
MMDLFQATARTADSLLDAITAGVRIPVHLTVTQNRVSLASVRFLGGRIRLRLHAAFLQAPDAVLQSLASYLRDHRREHWRTVAEFARSIHLTDPAAHPRRPRLEGQGRVWNLAAMAEDVNRTFFGGRVECQVGWGRGRPVRRRGRRSRSIRYGSWDAITRSVRMHPLLDDPRVPSEFVRYILFHEMLHAVVPAERKHGRQYVHSAQFRTLERQFPDLARMRVLSKTLLDVLV